MAFDYLKHVTAGSGLTDPIADIMGGESLAPYVKVYFGEDLTNPKFTVGNHSNPGDESLEHSSVVKSFEFGQSDGAGVKVEIIDTQGGSFTYFIKNLAKYIENSKSDFKMGVEWGWIVQTCNGGEEYSTPTLIKSPIVKIMIINIESFFGDGKIKYTITGSDSMQHVFAARATEPIGTEEKRIPLVECVKQFALNKGEPKFDVKFQRWEQNGYTDGIKWSEGGTEGPKITISPDGQNKLAVIQKTIEPFRTDKDKGLLYVWDTSTSTPTLLILEDPSKNANEVGGGDNLIIGRYVVNGGKTSPVISFTPQINWISALACLSSGGNSGGDNTAEPVEQDETVNKNIQGGNREVGSAQSVAVTRNAQREYGPNAPKETKKSQYAHQKASRMVSLGAAIEAELIIQGDPNINYVHAVKYIGRYIALAVINPFHLKGDANSIGSFTDSNGFQTNLSCGDWENSPMANEVMSNKRWRINGVNHSIREGSYTTTLKLMLLAPGVELPDDAKLGGDDDGPSYPVNS